MFLSSEKQTRKIVLSEKYFYSLFLAVLPCNYCKYWVGLALWASSPCWFLAPLPWDGLPPRLTKKAQNWVLGWAQAPKEPGQGRKSPKTSKNQSKTVKRLQNKQPPMVDWLGSPPGRSKGQTGNQQRPRFTVPS